MKSYIWTDLSFTPKFRNGTFQWKERRMEGKQLEKVFKHSKSSGLENPKASCGKVLTATGEYVSWLKLESPCYNPLYVFDVFLSPIPQFCRKKDNIPCGVELSYPTLKALTLHVSLFAVASVVLKSSCPLPSILLGRQRFQRTTWMAIGHKVRSSLLSSCLKAAGPNLQEGLIFQDFI